MTAASDQAVTLSTAHRLETGKTDETDSIDNGEFLSAVFGSELADVRPLVVSFMGNPGTVPGKNWFGRPWLGNSDLATSLPADAN